MSNYEIMVKENERRYRLQEEYAIEAMRKMYERQEKISVVALVKETGYSRGYFYNNEKVALEMRRLMGFQSGRNFAKERGIALEKAHQIRIAELEKENRILKIQIRELTEKNDKLRRTAQKRLEDYFNEL